jgi:excisionase family DNA binding protein
MFTGSATPLNDENEQAVNRGGEFRLRRGLCTFPGSGAYVIGWGKTERCGHAPHATLVEGRAMAEAITLMTIEEVARLLHYSVKTVYKKAAKGEIPSIPISPRKRLFSGEAIHYWLANKQVGNL